MAHIAQTPSGSNSHWKLAGLGLYLILCIALTVFFRAELSGDMTTGSVFTSSPLALALLWVIVVIAWLFCLIPLGMTFFKWLRDG